MGPPIAELGTHARRGVGIAVDVLICAVLAVTTYALAAASSSPPSTAGHGTGDVSGYMVSAVHYDLAADSGAIDGVRFTLASAPVPGATVRIRLSGSSQWYTCALSGADASCLRSGVPLGNVTTLTIDAAD
ncbi:MAG: hypothetical protein ACRDJI_03515 [Actinomycetota bacterium]